MTYLQPPLTYPNDCNFDTKQDLERELQKPDDTPCYQLAQKLWKLVQEGQITFTQDGRIVLHQSSVTDAAVDERQVTHAWEHLMRTLAYYVPQQLTKATKYRALFDDAVK